MKTKPIVISLAILIASAVPALAQSPTYVGVKKCALCHKVETRGNQIAKWEAHKHSKSLAALSLPAAAEQAQAMGVAKPTEDPKCLRCHAPLFEKAPDFKAESVSCEVCHGPGSGFATLAIMKNPEEAVKKGLILQGSPEKIKAHCLTCHDNPHGKPFEFASRWEATKHPLPRK
jgi:hypothetical protein